MVNLLLAVTAGKIINKLTTLAKKGGGQAAPGLYALKIEPKLIEKIAKQIPLNIVITGTNGKTTTARLIAKFAESDHKKVIRNSTGSNLERGVASTLVKGFKLSKLGLDQVDLGIWELDEAVFKSVAPKLQPKVVVFLNLFRDQLDRYGEIDTVLKKWQEAVANLSKETILILNADDNNVMKLKNSFKGRVLTFGLDKLLIEGEGVAEKRVKQKADFQAVSIINKGLSGSEFELKNGLAKNKIRLDLPGIYHIYDFLAAYVLSNQLGIQPATIRAVLASYQPAFGRVEKIKLGKIEAFIFLIKNPTGATEVFKTIAPALKKDDRLLLALNDNLADGIDVSWIWDADFEQFSIFKLQFTIASGKRAQDLAVRLKYAGFNPKQMTIEPSIKKALDRAKRGVKGRLFILPTYTALLELQSILAKSGLKKHYWEEK